MRSGRKREREKPDQTQIRRPSRASTAMSEPAATAESRRRRNRREMEEESEYFSVLPEGCVSDIISRTSPVDAIRSSAVSSGFRSAAESDTVWEKFLPSDYEQIISRSVSPVLYSSKKDLFFRLCQSPPILIDDSKLSFSLDRRSGKICYMISAKDLTIIWGSTPEYWKWTSCSESRFIEVAELRKVCWLEIRGKMLAKVLSTNTTYTFYLVFKISEMSYGLGSAEAYVRLVREIDANFATVYLKSNRLRHVHNGRLPQRREDGWMEIELGEFYNDQGDDGEVEMQLTDITSHWKSGLIIGGMELRPKENA